MSKELLSSVENVIIHKKTDGSGLANFSQRHKGGLDRVDRIPSSSSYSDTDNTHCNTRQPYQWIETI